MSLAKNILARAATIAVMSGAVVMLTGLFETRDMAISSTAAHKIATAQTNTVSAMADAWTGEINFAPAYAALNPYAEAASVNAASSFDPGDDYWGLPRQPGFETVAAYCSACHTLQIVMAQRQSRDGWDYLLHWMVEKQGMAEPPPETRAEILTYLTAAFGE